jgi:hypothetical protein
MVAAEMESFSGIQKNMAEGYRSLRNGLDLTEDELIRYLKGSLVKNYGGDNENLIISLPKGLVKST